MSYTPLNYEKLNIYSGLNNPSSIKSQNNRSFAFWQRALFQRALSTLEFSFPEEWDGNVKDFTLYCLFKYGYGVIANEKQFGLFFQPCTLNGYNFYYQPTQAIVSNPLLQKEYTIGVDCELLKLTPDYFGVFDIVDRYAEQLSLLDNAINMSLINGKFAWVLGAKTKAAAQALKKMLDEINKGNPAVVYDQRILDDSSSKSEPFQFLDLGNGKDRYLTTMQLQDLGTILNQFDTEIGIPTLPYEKKERLVTAEANSKQIESIARVTVWLETLQNSMKKVNDMFGTNMSVKLRFEEKGGCENVDNENDLSRDE